MNMQRPMPGLDAHLSRNPSDDGRDWDVIQERVDEKLLDMTPAEIAEFFGWDSRTVYEIATGQTKHDWLDTMGLEVAAQKLGVLS